VEQVLVIGGGVAGPATAMALQRAGIPATVFEARDRSTGIDVGAYLTVAVNGLDALDTLGLKEAVMAAGFPTSNIQFFNGTGKQLGDVPIGGTLPDGTVTHSLKRATLYGILHDAAVERGIAIEHGRRLTAVEQRDDGLIARFADGSTASGSVLIGADGIHSTLRTIIDPDAPSPRYTGMGNAGGFSAAGIADTSPGSYRMIFGKRAFFGYTVSPSGEIWWFANPPSDRPLSPRELGETSSDEWKQRLVELFAGDAGPAAGIIDATSGEIVVTNQYEMPRVPNWRRDRMLIIGDAAHAASPTSGQGASMAIEDAVVAAMCLRDIEDPSIAFDAHERQRRERVERVVAYGAERSADKVPGPLGRVIRDLMLPRILKRHTSPKSMQSLNWMFDHRIDWTSRVPPPPPPQVGDQQP
jgi:FAD-dependent urate hydroxylase